MEDALNTLADPERSHLIRRHRHLGKRRWDDLFERHVEEELELEGAWQQATQDRALWMAMKEGVVQAAATQLMDLTELTAGRILTLNRN